MNDSTNSYADDWSNYWQKGFLTTFVSEEGENYSGSIKKYWQTIFRSLQSSQNLVDLAAGNGALLELAQSNLKELEIDVQMVAIDIADINQSEFYTNHPDIKVLGNTSLSSTPLEQSSVDLCVSQFGFEYAEQDAAVKELARILKPTGRFHAVIHNASSEVTLHSKSAIEQIKLCRRSELAETTTKLLRRLQKLKKTNRDSEKDHKANELRDYFNAMAGRLMEYGEKLPDSQHIDYFLNELSNLFGVKAKEMTLEEKISIIDMLEIDSSSYHTRMQSMVNASKDQDAISQLKNCFSEHHFIVNRIEPLQENGRDLGWVFEAKK